MKYPIPAEALGDRPACQADGCGLAVKTGGLCSRHYMRAWRYGDPLAGGAERHKGRAFPAKACVICGASWTPKTRYQEARNQTCCVACRRAFITLRKRAAVDDIRKRLAAKISIEGDCHIWTGRRAGGYGRLSIDGRHVSAHRVAYTLAKGPIPEGLELDHLCRRRACINPDHLEPVTHLENVRRGAKVHPELGRSV